MARFADGSAGEYQRLESEVGKAMKEADRLQERLRAARERLHQAMRERERFVLDHPEFEKPVILIMSRTKTGGGSVPIIHEVLGLNIDKIPDAGQAGEAIFKRQKS